MKIVKKRELYKQYPKYSVYNIYKKIGTDSNRQPVWEYLYKTCEMNLFELKEEKEDKKQISDTIKENLNV